MSEIQSGAVATVQLAGKRYSVSTSEFSSEALASAAKRLQQAIAHVGGDEARGNEVHTLVAAALWALVQQELVRPGESDEQVVGLADEYEKRVSDLLNRYFER